MRQGVAIHVPIVIEAAKQMRVNAFKVETVAALRRSYVKTNVNISSGEWSVYAVVGSRVSEMRGSRQSMRVRVGHIPYNAASDEMEVGLEKGRPFDCSPERSEHEGLGSKSTERP